VKKQGAPKTLEEISNFPIVVYASPPGRRSRKSIGCWSITQEFRPRLKSASSASTISPAFCWRGRRAGDRVLPIMSPPPSRTARVLPDVPAYSFDVHLVYADALRQSKRVAAFREFLVKARRLAVLEQ